MNEDERSERIVCKFLRKIAPPREWEYLGEVEHYWISELCDELNKQLKAENAKLKRRLEILKDHGIEIVDAVAGGFEIYNKEHARADRLQAENEKLREMVRDMWPIARSGVCIDRCAHYDDCIRQYDERGCMLKQRMRELGIEDKDE